jgi:hypothetical protein
MRHKISGKIFHFLSIITIVVVLLRLFDGKILSGGDQPYIEFFSYGRRFLYLWFNINMGRIYANGSLFPPVSLFKIIGSIPRISPWQVQYLYFLLWYLLSYFSIRFFLRKITRISSPFSEMLALVYVFNPFTAIVFLHDRLWLIFPFIPIQFYFYHKMLSKLSFKYAVLISVASTFYSSANINPAITIPIYMVFFFYFLFFIMIKRPIKGKIYKLIFLHLCLGIFWILQNAWWLVGYLTNTSYFVASSRLNTFSAIKSGFLYDHFRFLGKWAWYAGHYLYRYYPYSTLYYTPLVIAISYIMPFLVLCGLMRKKKKKNLKVFLGVLYAISLFFVNGAKYLPGEIFNVLYKSSYVFRIFREPWSKFSSLLIFFSVMLVGFNFSRIDNSGNRKRLWLWSMPLFAVLILYLFPFISKSVVWDKWNGSMRSSRIEIPRYWKEFVSYNYDTGIDGNVLIFPEVGYGQTFNWPSGFNGPYNPLFLLQDKPIIHSVSFPSTVSDVIVNTFVKGRAFYNPRVLPFFNIYGILQENDLDWRYSSSLPPSISNKILTENGFKITKTYGLFTYDYLSQIPNEEPNSDKRSELYRELLNKPALVFYRVDNSNYFLPHFYIPRRTIYSSNKIDALPEIVGLSGYELRSAIYFADNADKKTRITRAGSADNADGKADNADEERIALMRRADEIVVEGKAKSEEILKQIIQNSAGALPVAYPKYKPGTIKWKLEI